MKQNWGGIFGLVSSVLICIGWGTMPADAQCVPRPPGLVGWWRAEDNAKDSAGAHNGSLLGGATTTAGAVGQAFQFTPSGQRVRVPDSPDFVLTNALSVEAWIKPAGPGGIIFTHSDKAPGPAPYSLVIDPTINKVHWGIASDTNHVVSVGAPIQFGAWQHVVGTWDGASGELLLYINGALVAQTNTPIRPVRPVLVANDGGIGIGNVAERMIDYTYNGLIDEVSLYSRALTANEILALYNADSDGKCLAIITPPLLSAVLTNGNLILSWPIAASDFNLLSTPGLDSPVWSQVPATLVTNATTVSATLEATSLNPQSCFRLYHP